MSVIQVVRDSAQELVRRAKALAERLSRATDTARTSAPAGVHPALTILGYLSFDLPRQAISCRQCGGQLRAVPVAQDYHIVCDSCEHFTYAGPYRQLIADMIGEARATLTRN